MRRDSARLPGPAAQTSSAGSAYAPVAPTLSAPRRPAPRRTAPPRRPRALPERAAVALITTDCAGALAGLWTVGPDAGPVAAGPLLTALLLAHHRAGLYRPHLAPAALDELPVIAPRTALAWAFAAAVVAATSPDDALTWPVLLTAVTLTALAACALRALVHRLRRSLARRRPGSTLIVGTGPGVRRLTAALHTHPEYGLRPVGIVAPGPAARPEDPAVRDLGLPLPLLTRHGEITRAVIQNSVRHAVVVSGPSVADPRTAATVRLLAARGCRLWQVSAGPGPVPVGAPAEAPAGGRPADSAGHLWGFAVRRLAVGPYGVVAGGPRRWAKRGLDAAVAAVALGALAPLLGACALAVRIADGPGVIFRQERIGLGGRPFTLLKFRTLRPRDEREAATRWNIADDRRMSGVGRLLRRTSLDELPQLWNVLRGDMSLVGPRPERPYFVRRFAQSHPGYQNRHRMPVGITGLAQVHGLRGDTSIADRTRFDNHYIDSWSLWRDVTILLRTAGSLFRLGGR
ncbi:sugar transferase [Streptomyces sp.]|uniref:sugar transferase n=1 Tax=Streptomyces sp. TaxID=1931 RepID=UPI002F413C20